MRIYEFTACILIKDRSHIKSAKGALGSWRLQIWSWGFQRGSWGYRRGVGGTNRDWGAGGVLGF